MDTEMKPQDAEGRLPTSMLFGPRVLREKFFQLCLLARGHHPGVVPDAGELYVRGGPGRPAAVHRGRVRLGAPGVRGVLVGLRHRGGVPALDGGEQPGGGGEGDRRRPPGDALQAQGAGAVPRRHRRQVRVMALPAAEEDRFMLGLPLRGCMVFCCVQFSFIFFLFLKKKLSRLLLHSK